MGPLLWLLQRDSPHDDHPFRAEACAIPVCGGELQAMTLGFFAFKRLELKLVEIAYPGLINQEPPYSKHPLGSFWMLSLDTLAKYKQDGMVQVRYAPFRMQTALGAFDYDTAALKRLAESVNQRKRKVSLMAEIAEMEASLEGKKEKLKDIERCLAED